MSAVTMLRRLLADARGTSFVEMGMLAPFFAMLALGTVDASRAVIDKMMLQQAASRSIEMVSAGGLDSSAFSNLQSDAAAAAGVSSSQVTVDAWLECDRVRQTSFDGDCTSTQEIGRYASVAINKPYSPWFASSLAGMGYNISQTITLQGKASVRLQ
jgi:Flp pilus assembly protein TadG